MQISRNPVLSSIVPQRATTQDISTQPAVHFGGEVMTKKGGIFRAGKWVALAAALFGWYGVASSVETNKPGTHSLVFDRNNGGYQRTVHGPGRVWLGLGALIPGQMYNTPLNTSDQSVVEIIQPNTQESQKIPKLAIQIEFAVPAEKMPEVVADKLSGQSSFPDVPDETIFIKTDDALNQRVYLTLLKNTIRGYVNDLSTDVSIDNYHHITDYLSMALNHGLKDYAVRNRDGSIKLRNEGSLQDKVGSLVKIKDVKVIEMDLPTEVLPRFEEKAQRPLETLIEGLKKEYEGIRKQKENAEAQVKAVTNEERQIQQAEVNRILANGRIQIEGLKGEILEVEAQTTAEKEAILRRADQQSAEIKARADQQAAQIAANASRYGAETRAKADAGVTAATGKANSEAARLRRTPYQQSPRLLELETINAAKNAALAWAKNPNASITFIDPATGLNMDFLNIGNGQDTNGILNTILGTKAADKLKKGGGEENKKPPENQQERQQ